MAHYCVNKNAQDNGDHEVHVVGCTYYPAEKNRLPLGDHNSCGPAVTKANETYKKSNGCFYCCKPCHTT